MTKPIIDRFDAAIRLQRWDDIPSADLVSGTPVQNVHFHLPPDKHGMQAGVWDCTAMTMKPGPYSVNEFMMILEGEVTIVESGGRETTVRAGESFVIPKGLVCQWKQPGYVKKFFVIFDDPSGKTAKDPAALRVIKLDPKAPLAAAASPDPASLIGPVPKWHDKTLFEDATGQWTVGLWSSTAFHRKPGPIARHELMHLLEGSVTLPDGKGGTRRFTAGDTFFVPLGAQYEWNSSEFVKKIFCTFVPKAG